MLPKEVSGKAPAPNYEVTVAVRVAAAVRDWMKRLRAALIRPVDGASLAVFRIVFGANMVWELSRFFARDRILSYYVAPKLLFPYFGFGWLPRLPAAANQWAFSALIALALAILCGAWYRVATPLFFLGYSYFFLLDQTHYQNHLYLFCLLSLLFVFVDAHRVWSVDAWRKRVTPHVPGWQVAVVAFQLGVVYFFGGINKLSPEWLSGAPMDIHLASLRARDWVPAFFQHPLVSYVFTWLGLAIDLAAVPLLLLPRSRLWMLAALGCFHLTNAMLFSIGVFPWFMLFGTTAFLPPNWPRRLLHLRQLPPAADVAAAPAWRARLLGFLVSSHVFLQLFVPLRHYLYPGNWLWTRDGDYFSWTMKLTCRTAQLKLFVTDPSGHENEAPLYVFLTPKQIWHMSYTPEMIWRANAYVAKALDSGYQARWVSRISINGRPYQDYVIGDSAELAKRRVSLRATELLLPFDPVPPPSPESRVVTRNKESADAGDDP